MAFLPIFCGILMLIAIPIAIVIKLKMNKEIKKIDVTANMPLVENICRTEFTNGYCFGVVKRQVPRKNGTTLIEYYPIDVEQGEEIPRPSLQSVIVKNEFIVRLPTGDPSSYRVMIKLVGRNPADYPKQMRETLEGDYMTTKGQQAYLEATFGKAIPAGDEAIAEAMKTYARGNIPKSVLAQIKETNEISRKNALILQSHPETPLAPEKK